MTEPMPDQRVCECGKQMAIAAVPIDTVDGAVHPPTLVAAFAFMEGSRIVPAAPGRREGQS
jgi:hypothetical protein